MNPRVLRLLQAVETHALVGGREDEILEAWEQVDRQDLLDLVGQGRRLGSGPSSPRGRAMELREAAKAVLEDLRCPHEGNLYGNCHDCMNGGYIITCQQEQDLVEGCLLVVRATRELTEDRSEA